MLAGAPSSVISESVTEVVPQLLPLAGFSQGPPGLDLSGCFGAPSPSHSLFQGLSSVFTSYLPCWAAIHVPSVDDSLIL